MRCCSETFSILVSLGVKSWSCWLARERLWLSPSATSRADGGGRSCRNGFAFPDLFPDRSKLTGTSPDLEVLGRFLTTARHNLIFYHLPLIEGPQARTFDSRDVDEYILAPGFRLDEPVTLSRIEPLHGALSHLSSP